MRKDRVLNILLYEKKTRLINSLFNDQGMREGQPSLKGFCALGLKAGFRAGKFLRHSSTRIRPQVPSCQGYLATNKTNVLLTGTLTNPVTAFLIPFFIFMTYFL